MDILNNSATWLHQSSATKGKPQAIFLQVTIVMSISVLSLEILNWWVDFDFSILFSSDTSYLIT